MIIWRFTQWLIYWHVTSFLDQGTSFKWDATVRTKSFCPFTEAVNLMQCWTSFLKINLMHQLRDDSLKTYGISVKSTVYGVMFSSRWNTMVQEPRCGRSCLSYQHSHWLSWEFMLPLLTNLGSISVEVLVPKRKTFPDCTGNIPLNRKSLVTLASCCLYRAGK